MGVWGELLTTCNWLPEAAVTKVKNATGKVARSSLVHAATEIDTSPYWSTRMSQYLKDVALQMECDAWFKQKLGGKTIVEAAHGMNPDLMLQVLNKMAEWRSNLRSKAVETLEANVMDALSVLGKAGLNDKSPDVTTATDKLLAEACVVFPFNEELIRMQEQLAEKLAGNQQEQLAHKASEILFEIAVGLERMDEQTVYDLLVSFVSESTLLLKAPEATVAGMVVAVDGLPALLKGWLLEKPQLERLHVDVVVDFLLRVANFVPTPFQVALPDVIKNCLELNSERWASREKGRGIVDILQT